MRARKRLKWSSKRFRGEKAKWKRLKQEIMRLACKFHNSRLATKPLIKKYWQCKQELRISLTTARCTKTRKASCPSKTPFLRKSCWGNSSKRRSRRSTSNTAKKTTKEWKMQYKKIKTMFIGTCNRQKLSTRTSRLRSWKLRVLNSS